MRALASPSKRVFRLLNVIGSLPWIFMYEPWRHMNPEQSRWSKAKHLLLLTIICFANARSLLTQNECAWYKRQPIFGMP